MFYSQQLHASVSRNQNKLCFWKRREEDPYIKQRHRTNQPEIYYSILNFRSNLLKIKENFKFMHVRSNTRKVSDPRKVFRHTTKFQTHAKIWTHAKSIDPRQNPAPSRPTQIFGPRHPCTNLLTHPHDPRHSRAHATHTI